MCPIYDYECPKCNNKQEIVHQIDEDPSVICEKCSSKMSRIITGTSFRLKGGGWMPHKKDYFGEGLD